MACFRFRFLVGVGGEGSSVVGVGGGRRLSAAEGCDVVGVGVGGGRFFDFAAALEYWRTLKFLKWRFDLIQFFKFHCCFSLIGMILVAVLVD